MVLLLKNRSFRHSRLWRLVIPFSNRNITANLYIEWQQSSFTIIASIIASIGSVSILSMRIATCSSPSLFQSLSLIISITANISGINKQSQKLTLCADKYASLPYTKAPPEQSDGAFGIWFTASPLFYISFPADTSEKRQKNHRFATEKIL